MEKKRATKASNTEQLSNQAVMLRTIFLTGLENDNQLSNQNQLPVTKPPSYQTTQLSRKKQPSCQAKFITHRHPLDQLSKEKQPSCQAKPSTLRHLPNQLSREKSDKLKSDKLKSD